MKYCFLVLVLWIGTNSLAQNLDSYERPPIFPGCDSLEISQLKQCLFHKIQSEVYNSFQVPDDLAQNNYVGQVQVLFEINSQGQTSVLYIDAINESLKKETNRVFELMPQMQPGTYNGIPTYFQYSLTIKIPLQPVGEMNLTSVEDIPVLENDLERESAELDSINKSLIPYNSPEYDSYLNIPFTHHYYDLFDSEMNRVGTNAHTAAKPFQYSEVKPYFSLKDRNEKLKKNATSWVGRKFWDEHLVRVQSKDYWFVIDPIFDLQVGKDSEADFSSTYNNTRGFTVQGGLGKRLNFYTSVFESQGRFAEYYNNYALSIRGREAAVIPGRGISKLFKDDGFDYPVAEAYLSYSPIDILNVQFGHGKNFIGDGYRSLFQSDFGSPYPFFKISTKFWKIKYTNTWMWLKDIRGEVSEERSFLRKYMANHYLSWNVSKRLNIGLFESVLWYDSNDRGFDVNYLNPIIFYRAIEFETGQGAGNAIVGASAKYKWNNKVNLYSQVILDEFSLPEIRKGNKSWKNKFGYQIGLKYFEPFDVENLNLQIEYNRVRPYTYSHNTIILNYANTNQPMAHAWGANFSEFIIIGRYKYNRWFGDAKLVFGKRGYDFNTEEDNFFYGGDIYRTENDRVGDSNIKVAQGNTTNIFYGELIGGYILNPVSRLHLFAQVVFRNFNPEVNTAEVYKSNTAWFSVGVKTDLFNWYWDL